MCVLGFAVKLGFAFGCKANISAILNQWSQQHFGLIVAFQDCGVVDEVF